MMRTKSGRVIVWGEQIAGNILFTELCVFDSSLDKIAILKASDGTKIKIELPNEIATSINAGKTLKSSFRIID